MPEKDCVPKAEKVTSMTLEVDLQCPSCHKKVKKILCKFPQIRDQVYDKKKNLVKITVVCCSPEKIRDKLYCKGGKVIKCIKIEKPQEPPTEQPKPKKPTKPDEQPEKEKFCCPQRCVCLGPCYCRCGIPVPPPPPPPCYDNYYYYRGGYGYGYNSHCDYFIEENSGACRIM